MNRETYLNLITNNYIRQHFIEAGYNIPANVRMSCSLTSTKKAIGQCWSSINSADDTYEIFISPVISDSSRVIDILIHELAHATVGLKAGHKAPFKACAIAVGLEGKMTATTATEALKSTIAQWIAVEGEYPHATLTQSGAKKQSTRMIKCHCSGCGYQVYTSRKWLEVSIPTCPDLDCTNNGWNMTVNQPDDSDD